MFAIRARLARSHRMMMMMTMLMMAMMTCARYACQFSSLSLNEYEDDDDDTFRSCFLCSCVSVLLC